MRILLLVAVLVVACHAQEKCDCQWIPSGIGKDTYLSMYGLASSKLDAQSIRIFQLQRWVEKLRDQIENAVVGKAGSIARAIETKVSDIEGNGCSAREFQCGGVNRRCISNLLVCDGDNECPNGADESDAICQTTPASGTTWSGNIHWKACKLRNDQVFRMTIVGNRRKNYFKPRVAVTAAITTEFKQEGQTMAKSYVLEGFYAFGNRRLILFPKSGGDNIGAVCHFLGGGQRAGCNMVLLGVNSDPIVCASGRLKKQ